MNTRDQHEGAPAIDPTLAAAIDGRADAAELRAAHGALPATDASVSASRREAAWAQLSARLHDPARVPFTDDVRPPIELVRDDAVAIQQQRMATPVTAAPVVAVPDGDRTRPAPAAHVALRRRRMAFKSLFAASLLAAAGAGGVWAAGERVYELPVGAAPTSVQLADGSSAWLAPGARLAVSRRLGWPSLLAPATRDVSLQGEAYFDVQRDGRGFRVRAGEMAVQVLGTRFAVRTARAGVSARVEVNEGRVAVVAAGVREELVAGQGITLRNGALRRVTVEPARVATWRTGGLAALDEPLGAVLSELARRFAVEIDVDDDVDVASSVSLFYAQAPSIDVLLGDLCTAQGLSFTRTSRGFRIVRP